MLKLWLKANRPRAFALAAISVVFQAMSAYSLYLISPQLNSLIGGNFAWLLRLALLKLALDLSGNLLLAVNSYLFSQQSQEAIDSYRQKGCGAAMKAMSSGSRQTCRTTWSIICK